jgi:hypothetical protein
MASFITRKRCGDDGFDENDRKKQKAEQCRDGGGEEGVRDGRCGDGGEDGERRVYTQRVYRKEFWESVKGCGNDLGLKEEQIIASVCPSLVVDDYAQARYIFDLLIEDGKNQSLAGFKKTVVMVDGSEMIRSIAVEIKDGKDLVALPRKGILWHDWSSIVDSLDVFQSIRTQRDVFLTRIASQLRYQEIRPGVTFQEERLDCDFMILAEGCLEIVSSSNDQQLKSLDIFGEVVMLFPRDCRAEAVSSVNVDGVDIALELRPPRKLKATKHCKCLFLPRGCFQPIIRYLKNSKCEVERKQYFECILKVMKVHGRSRSLSKCALAKVLSSTSTSRACGKSELSLHPWESSHGNEVLGKIPRTVPSALLKLFGDEKVSSRITTKVFEKSTAVRKLSEWQRRSRTFMKWVLQQRGYLSMKNNHEIQMKEIEKIIRRVHLTAIDCSRKEVTRKDMREFNSDSINQNCTRCTAGPDKIVAESGQRTCVACGLILEHKINHGEGNSLRIFEDDTDKNKNHVGMQQNTRRSDEYNAGSSGGDRYKATQRKASQQSVRTNDVGTTGTMYKDFEKDKTDFQMERVGEALGLMDETIERAKTLFSYFRDDRQKVVKKQGVIAACLIIACREVYRNRKPTTTVTERLTRLAIKDIDFRKEWPKCARQDVSKQEMVALKSFLCIKNAMYKQEAYTVFEDISVFVHLPQTMSQSEKQEHVKRLCDAYKVKKVPAIKNDHQLVVTIPFGDGEKRGISTEDRAHGDFLMLGDHANMIWSLADLHADPVKWIQKTLEYFRANEHAVYACSKWWWALPLLPLLNTEAPSKLTYEEYDSLQCCVEEEPMLGKEIDRELDPNNTGLVQLGTLKKLLCSMEINSVPERLWEYFVYSFDMNRNADPDMRLISYKEFFYFCQHRQQLDRSFDPVKVRSPKKTNAIIATKALKCFKNVRDKLSQGWNEYVMYMNSSDDDGKDEKRKKAVEAFKAHKTNYYVYLKKSPAVCKVVKEDWDTAKTIFGKILMSLLKNLYSLSGSSAGGRGYIQKLFSTYADFFVIWGDQPTLDGWRSTAKHPNPFPPLFPAIDDMMEILKEEAQWLEETALLRRTESFWSFAVLVSSSQRKPYD